MKYMVLGHLQIVGHAFFLERQWAKTDTKQRPHLYGIRKYCEFQPAEFYNIHIYFQFLKLYGELKYIDLLVDEFLYFILKGFISKGRLIACLADTLDVQVIEAEWRI